MALSRSRQDREFAKFVERTDGQTAVAVDVEISDKTGGGGGSTANSTYGNLVGDFTATATASAKTVVISGLPFTLTADAVIAGSTRVVTSAGVVSDVPLTTVTVSSNTITYTDKAANFASGDTVIMTVVGPDKSYDTSLDVVKNIDQAPTWSRYTDKEDLISAAQVLTTSFADLGAEIDMRGYNQLGLWLTVDINGASNIEVRILHKHTSAGSEEFREIYLGSPTSNITTINLNDYQFASDADQLTKFNIPVSGTSSFIQVQARMATDGGTDADIDAAAITKAYAA